MMTKQELRKLYLQKRLALSAGEYQELSRRMTQQFCTELDLSRIQVLHTFLPIEKNFEPNTWLIIDEIKKRHPDIKISIPKINNQTAALDNFYFESAEQLEKNTWGILEPRQGVPTPIEKIDMVLVPLLAVDEQGHRVGYGRGFYDKFLTQCKANTRRVGLSFYPPVKNISDTHNNDQTLTHLVTPEKVFTF